MCISAATYQKLFIFGMGLPGRGLFHSIFMDPWVMPRDEARGQKLGHLSKGVYCSLFIQTTSEIRRMGIRHFITSTFSVKRSRSL